MFPSSSGWTTVSAILAMLLEQLSSKLMGVKGTSQLSDSFQQDVVAELYSDFAM